MKILQVNDTTERHGGAETYLYNLIDLLKKNNHEVKIFGSEKFQNKLSFITRFYDPFTYFKFSKKIKEFKPDVIHIHKISHTISPSVLHAAKKKNISIVMTVHDFHQICPDDWFIYKDGKPCKYGFSYKCLITKCYRSRTGYKYLFYKFYNFLKLNLHRYIIKNNIDVFITPSTSLAKWLKKSLEVNNIKMIPHFIDKNKVEYKSLKQTQTILYVGRLAKGKGIEYIVRAIPLILKEIQEAGLVIVGSGPEEKNLKKLARQININRNVTFTGRIEHSNLKRYYQNAEIIVIPSYCAENFPLVILEAMAHGRPIVVSNIFGLSECIRKNDVGFLFEPADPKDLADKVISILSNFDLAKKMSGNARKKVEEFYSANRHYEELMKIYKGLV